MHSRQGYSEQSEGSTKKWMLNDWGSPLKGILTKLGHYIPISGRFLSLRELVTHSVIVRTGIFLISHRVRLWLKAVIWWGLCTNRDSCAPGAKNTRSRRHYPFGVPWAPKNKLSPASKRRTDTDCHVGVAWQIRQKEKLLSFTFETKSFLNINVNYYFLSSLCWLVFSLVVIIVSIFIFYNFYSYFPCIYIN